MVHMRHLINVSVSLLFGFGCAIPFGDHADSFPATGLVFGDLVLFGERHTPITKSHKSKASSPSFLNPASNEIISDSVEL